MTTTTTTTTMMTTTTTTMMMMAMMMMDVWNRKTALENTSDCLLRQLCETEIHHVDRGEFRPRQTRQLPRAVDLKGRLLSSQSY